MRRAAHNGHNALESPLDRPIVAVHDVQKKTDTTDPAAHHLVSRLVKFGVLGEMASDARNRRFRDTPDIALFDDAGPSGGAVAAPE
jgi:hypothetical protein